MAAIEVVEPLSGGWINNRAWGARFQGKLPAMVAGKIANIAITANSNIPGPPRSQSINLFRGNWPEALSTNNVNSDVRARITYGAGAASNTFECDWVQGCQLQVVASAITIEAAPYAPIKGTLYDPIQDIVLGATIGTGPVGSPLAPTWTSQYVQLDPSQALRMMVPAFARRFTPFVGELPEVGEVDVLAPLTIVPGIYVAFARGNLSLCQLAMAPGESCVIPGGCNMVRIHNATGDSFRCAGVFELGL